MKKIISVILAIILTVSCIPFASAALRGDVDGNGKVNSSDALRVLQYAVGQIASIPTAKADVNSDGKVNSSDALIILQISVGLINNVKAGFIFLHDENSTYDKNFMTAAAEACRKTGTEIISIINVPESSACYDAAEELVEKGCDIIFADSFGHEDFMIQAAKDFPNVEFVHATGTKAHTEKLSNYHNAYAAIYEGRYLSGIAAGMKLNEMIADGRFQASEAKLGFVGSFTYAEVISSYTAFYLGAKSVCPTATMDVLFTGSWYDETAEKEAAEQLIYQGCKLISQYSDSMGAPMACEYSGIPNISYNGSTESWCPNTYITTTKIDWTPYFTYAITCVQNGKAIDTDYTGTLADGSVVIENLNNSVAASGTQAVLDSAISNLKSGTLHVFDTSTFTVYGKKVKSYKADVDTDEGYTPDTEVISDGYFHESEFRSAPYFDLRTDGIILYNEKF